MEVLSPLKMEEQWRILVSLINTKHWLVNRLKRESGNIKYQIIKLCRSAPRSRVRHSVHHQQLPGGSVPCQPLSLGAGQESHAGQCQSLSHILLIILITLHGRCWCSPPFPSSRKKTSCLGRWDRKCSSCFKVSWVTLTVFRTCSWSYKRNFIIGTPSKKDTDTV